jgi:repressor LexA
MDSGRPRRRTSRGERQRRRILEFVPEFARREGYAPSQREIAEGLGLGLATVNYHLSVLEQDGSLHRGAGQPRTLAEPGDPASPADGDAVELPLIGQIAAGTPWTPWNWLKTASGCRGGWSGMAPCSCSRSRGTR